MNLRLKRLLTSGFIAFVLGCGAAWGQGNKQPPPVPAQAVSSSPAYAEILFRKTELEAELESQLTEYTEEFPRIKELRFEAAALEKENERIRAVKPAESGKLTQALGRLIVRKCELETELWKLRNQYKDGHPDVKRAKRKAEIFEQAIKSILG